MDLLNKKILDHLKETAKIYNDGRLHRPFQAEEVEKYIAWLYKQYGYEYESSTDN